MGANGPNVSSLNANISLVAPDTTVGSKKDPPKEWRLPPITTFPPFLIASLTCSSTFAMALSSINGPMTVPSALPLPTFNAPTALENFSTKVS